MEFRTPTVSPLRQRMLDDMRMRKLQPRTQAGHIRAVRRLATFLERAPDTASADDLRRFQLHLVDQGASPITINATLTALKFFFEITLSRGELLGKIQPELLVATDGLPSNGHLALRVMPPPRDLNPAGDVFGG